MVTELRHQTRSNLISSSWGAIHRRVGGTGYRALGRRPDPEEPWRPELYMADAKSPVRAYRQLVRITGRPWYIAMLQRDIEELIPDAWEQLRTVIPALRVISPFVLAWAEPIWAGVENPDQAIGAWLAFAAAQSDELVVRDIL